MLDKSIKKTLVIGSGPIIIGQAAEFDYSGTQACETLKKEGIEVVLINSNPATIMTDKAVADRIYIEPITVEFVEKVIAKERPDSILAGMGGQTALNMAVELAEKGILDKYGVKVIGTPIESIKRGEDRELFREAMEKIGEPIIKSKIVESLEEGFKVANEIGYPVVVRPAYTLGGTGGGFANNDVELEDILSKGLALSRVGQVLIEKSILGWKEIEYEVIRDANGNAITVCNMENIDPVGIHTGDSIVVAPSQTLSDREYQMLRTSALKIVNEIGVVGGCNVQFALHPKSFEYAIIEINPRVSRSSALASKATGYPIARVATRLSLGYLLDEVKNEVTGKTFACFEPALDYIVVKIPKWPFDKFKKANKRLGTKMMATGEVMAIGNNFEAAFQKGLRSLEIGRFSFEHPVVKKMTIEELKAAVVKPDDERIFVVAEMLRRGYIKERLQKLTGIDKFFMEKIEWIVKQEELLKKMKFKDLDEHYLRNLKKKGFSDKGIASLMGISERDIERKRKAYNIIPTYKMVDTCAGEFAADSSYFYSTYDQFDEVVVSNNRKVVVIGSGPIRIGQGIEFDYCTVHAVKTLKKLGIESIIINNNPETVSTDFSTADKLYFEPLVTEDIMAILEKEKPEGVILQFGGQTAIKLANDLSDRGIKIIGTSADKIDEAEDRERFEEMMEELNINRPKGRGVWDVAHGIEIANEIGYPVLVRPSYVLGGQGMEICHDEYNLVKYLEASFERDSANPVLIDKYLNGIELEVDAICDGEDVLIPGVMEHLERAGVHSGDSITIYPQQNLYEGTEEELLEITKKMAKALEVKGMMNIQFIAYQNKLYVIEVNPRSSRTVPYISKVSGVPAIEIATRVALGEKLKDLGYGTGIYKKPNVVAVKVPVFSTEKLSSVEVSLGPEMRSTGEVLGVGNNVDEAIFKGLLGAKRVHLIQDRKILVTIRDKDKEEFLPIAKSLVKHGSTLFATKGTQKFLAENGVESTLVNRIGEESPNINDVLKNREVDLLINTPTKANDAQRDGFKMRRTAIEYGVDVLTSLDTINAILRMQDSHIDESKLDVFDVSKI
ncbi:MAG: carbamoyl-phosphate synthase large subunit [Fusobacterium mortiferum]|jgi:carbamoyl-phosphate synthase large subunit|uniref:carbamoyl-phosphate synthase large subunit n=1 Tax=Fusobacterium mortiferum TaxID=850 RepID=UPI001F36453A|nr:carbamoyl-phosphate synthase large subunit [Fusobacterium mortiferum]MCF2627426.1 carbamoyl-phosphate synthase large subunit [Fusobacterium mortiferum]MCF2698920.1 carbamoyl-phosphate synthase large subunit [Fusobacterium mortiferum]MCI7187628.1 carbamoyl-phosphate synthase large subunit [Fusobacterium mortiferum]MDY2800471.1 carbamoyl-phosphate synthase large subunit [Fusobacterium mortiferum]MDY4801881.1 carbamoyl-phosphate synthase large subunit [Fusobacterium mortiferum]